MKPEESLAMVCNAPTDRCGIYIVYAFKKNSHQVIYIGSSGKMQKNGTIKTRKGGMKDRLVNGKDSNGIPRRKSWGIRMKEEGISELKVHWWVTFDENIRHIPQYVEGLLIQEFYDTLGRLPAWNNEF